MLKLCYRWSLYDFASRGAAIGYVGPRAVHLISGRGPAHLLSGRGKPCNCDDISQGCMYLSTYRTTPMIHASNQKPT